MRHEPNLRVDGYRKRHPDLGLTPGGANWGYFEIGELRAISSGSWKTAKPDEPRPENPELENWEHVSVSCRDRCPTWQEMAKVKNLFWEDEETVIQFHPKKSRYYNFHPYTLHLWKKADEEHELPPAESL